MSEICNYCEVDFDYHDHSHLACECLPKQIQLLEANLARCREEKDAITNAHDMWKSQWREVQNQLSVYKEALEFYANMKNYEITIPNNIISDERVVSITSVVDKSQFVCMILRDEGMKAQRALTPVQSPDAREKETR